MAQAKFDWQDKIGFAGHEIYMQGKKMDGLLDSIIEGHVEKLQPDHGQARISLLLNVLQKLTVDGENVPVGPGAASSGKRWPTIWDPEERETLTDRLLRYIVSSREPWIADKYEQTFAKFMVDDDSESLYDAGKTTNPTKSGQAAPTKSPIGGGI